MSVLLGAIDAGGTSWRCAVAAGPNRIIARAAFPTTTPEQTLARAAAFFAAQPTVATIGVACFGPIAVNPDDERWGQILSTPKPGWSGADVAGELARATGARISLDTDVNAAVLAERAWGAGQGLDDLAYVTVGTGIGAGLLVGGRTVRGALHPEAGHMRAPRHRDDDFPGVCPFHGDCIEGLASAPAIAARWGVDPAQLPDRHPAWDLEAHYLGHLAASLILTAAVRRVIFGGGVMARGGLVERVAAKTSELIGPYGPNAPGEAGVSVVGAGLGADAGLLGGLWLALDATGG